MGKNYRKMLKNMCEYIVEKDKTPEYSYSQADKFGKLPGSGSRWLTPKEYANDILRELKKENVA